MTTQTAHGFPVTSLGTPIIMANKVPPGYSYSGAGRGDAEETPAIGVGTLFALSRTDQGEEALTFGWLDHVYLLGGTVFWVDADVGDYLGCKLYAPASTAHAGSGGDQGVVLSDLGGGNNVIVPVASGNTHYVDLSRWDGTEAEKEVSPVPAFDADGNPIGWWDWDEASGVTPNMDQQGRYNLLDFDQELWRHVVDIPLLGNGEHDICPETVKPKKLLPTWRITGTLHRETAGTVKASWFIHLARKRTTI